MDTLKEQPKFNLDLDIPTIDNQAIEANIQVECEELRKLTDEEREQVKEFSKKIDITNSDLVINYGSQVQEKLDGYCGTVLNEIKTKDLGETGELIGQVVFELSSSSDIENKGVFGFIKRGISRAKQTKIKYEAVEKNIDNIVEKLREHQMILRKDCSTLQGVYDQNITFCKELQLYIAAGELALAEARSKVQQLAIEAQTLGTQESAQAYSDYVDQCDRFEKRLHDLRLTRIISIQMAPQIRIIQKNSFSMEQKIQSTIVNTIPLWRSQLVISLGAENSLKAAKAEKQVSDLTSQLLKKNADALHMSSVQTAQELERGIVDIEALKYTNNKLVETLNEIIQIQNSGRAARLQATSEIKELENQLRGSMFRMSTVQVENVQKQDGEQILKLKL